MSDATEPEPAEDVKDPELPAPLPGGGTEPTSAPGLEPPIRRRLSGRRVALCVTGSIAAYKSAILLRLLRKEAAQVEVVLSRSAEKFIGRATFAGLNQKPPLSDMFAPDQGGELHVDLATRSDLVLIAPASADLLARLAAGRADDLISALALCARVPILVAPAMHPDMWSHPATRRNVRTLAEDGRISFVGPVHGEVASGDSGVGRMAEPETILGFAVAQLTKPMLRDRRIVVTAGPTAEDLDPVRYLGNRSSGKMGFAIAERAAAHGASVTLITGPVALPTPPGVQRVNVRSALAMRGALWQALKPDLSAADALIMAAAVADYRPAETHAAKIKRGEEPLKLELVPNPDLLAEIGDARHGTTPVLVGFALETDADERLIHWARQKLTKKKVDLIVANRADESIGLADVRATLVSARSADALPPLPKDDAADRILDWVAARFRAPRSEP
jgi:phosphopantothenoylcysteine decarboxylase / phosphopantothenate---cysteine ligase